jgi:hypothetical protein
MTQEECGKLIDYEARYLNKAFYDTSERASFKALKISNFTKNTQRSEINRTRRLLGGALRAAGCRRKALKKVPCERDAGSAR